MMRTAVFESIFLIFLCVVSCDHLFSKKKIPAHILSTANGAPVAVRDFKTQNSSLIDNDYFLESASHFVRENIPDRIVHSKGAGAFGYFEVLHNISHICRAKLFSHNGKTVPIAVRFSIAFSDKGTSDTVRGPRGFSVRFFTEDGNFDIVGLNLPVFMIKDPILYPSVAHTQKKNPSSNLKDKNAEWDFISQNPESLYSTLILYGDDGVPDGYRRMPGRGIHTYQIYNSIGEIHFVRFHFIPDTSGKDMFKDRTSIMKDPDFATRDLHDSIEKEEFPSWTVKIQVLTMDDYKEAQFDIFDVTRTLPQNSYPLQTLGKITLFRNPKNYFAEVEQMAFNPANLVPGILGAPDKMFQARKLIYRDALNYRLGVNYNNIRTNCPIKSPYSYSRDGKPPVLSNGLNRPHYMSNSFNGLLPIMEHNRPQLVQVKTVPPYNLDQCSNYYNSLSEEQKSTLIENIVLDLREVAYFIQQRTVNHLNAINADFSRRISELLPLN